MILSRTYRPEDMAGCLALFDSNTPRFFDVSEREGFVGFLEDQALRWPYQVIERDGRIVGCGGHAVEADGVSVTLCWGMVDNSLHGQGLGRVLMDLAVEQARAAGYARLRLYTHERMVRNQAIYARAGFAETHRVTENGLHRVYMEKPL